MSTTVVATEDALFTRLRTDPDMRAALGATPTDSHVYSGLARRDAALPYITLSSTNDRPGGAANVFGSEAYTAGRIIDIFTAGTSQRPVLVLYALLESVLRKAPLELSEGTVVRLKVELIRVILEPDNAAQHGVVSVRTDTRAG